MFKIVHTYKKRIFILCKTSCETVIKTKFIFPLDKFTLKIY